MAGLLDTFFGNADQTQALGLLGAQMMRGRTADGLMMANQYMGQAPQRQLQTQLQQAQLAETLAQAEERKMRIAQAERQQEMMNRLLFPQALTPQPLPSSQNNDGPFAMRYGPEGSSGMAQMPSPPVPAGEFPMRQEGGAPTTQQGGILGLSQRLGIPVEAIQADIAFNGGRKISELLAERSKPNWQNINGNLVNTNAPGFQGGFQPGMAASNDGRVTMWQPDGQGGVVVGAPRGALDTYGAYQNVTEGTKANYDPLTVTPAGQPPQMTTRGAIARNPQVQGRTVPQGVQAERDGERSMILQVELAKAREQLNNALRVGDQSGAARAQADIAALNRELGGRGATVGMPLQSEADKLREQKGVEGDSTANQARSKDVKTAQKFLQIAQQAEEVLKSGPTASGIGSAVDAGASLFGVTTKGAEAAQRLKALGGWLVANVPRMEGPQSNFDVANYQVMAAEVSNDRLPVERRLAALDAIKRMMREQIDGGPAGGSGAAPAAGGGWSIREKK